jgi:hypothetical protein
MSLIPAEEVTYVDSVGEFFLAQRGTGLMISSPDVELLRGYEGAGIPATVLCRGIERAFERRRQHGKPPHRTLSACKRTLDAEVKRFLAGAGRPPGDLPSAETLDRLVALAKSADRPEDKAAYRAAYRAACAGGHPSEAAGLAFLRALPSGERRRVAQGARAVLGQRVSGASRAEYRERLRSILIERVLGMLPVPLTASEG